MWLINFFNIFFKYLICRLLGVFRYNDWWKARWSGRDRTIWQNSPEDRRELQMAGDRL